MNRYVDDNSWNTIKQYLINYNVPIRMPDGSISVYDRRNPHWQLQAHLDKQMILERHRQEYDYWELGGRYNAIDVDDWDEGGQFNPINTD